MHKDVTTQQQNDEPADAFVNNCFINARRDNLNISVCDIPRAVFDKIDAPEIQDFHTFKDGVEKECWVKSITSYGHETQDQVVHDAETYIEFVTTEPPTN